MIAPEVLDALLRAGASAEMIVAAVKADAAMDESKAENRRAKDRERQRRHRMSRDVTVTDCDSTDIPSPLSPPLKSTPYPEKITPPITPQPIVEDARDPLEVLWEVVNAIAEHVRKTLPPPVGVSKDQWRAFRKQRKKSLTDRAYLMICNKLSALADAGWPPGDMIDLAIERGWETVFAPRQDNRNGQSSSNITSLRGHRPDPALDLLRAASAAEDWESRGGIGPSLPAIGSG
jgi:hypothetical protein